MRVLVCVLVILLIGCTRQPDAGEKLIGRWCDVLVENNDEYDRVFEIRRLADGGFEGREIYGDGTNISIVNFPLRSSDPTVYNKDNSANTQYRVMENGDLELVERLKPFAIIKRIDSYKIPNECRQL